SPAARRSSTARAWASAPSSSTYRNACTARSTAAIRSRCAWVISTELAWPDVISPASSTAVLLVRSSLMSGLLGQDPRTLEALPLDRRRGGQRLLRGQAGLVLVRSHHVGQRQGVRRRRDVGGGEGADLRDPADDQGERRV